MGAVDQAHQIHIHHGGKKTGIAFFKGLTHRLSCTVDEDLHPTKVLMGLLKPLLNTQAVGGVHANQLCMLLASQRHQQIFTRGRLS